MSEFKIDEDLVITSNPYSYKNRGMTLEDLINRTNENYIKDNIAYIYKRPTPIKVARVNKDSEITKAFYEKKSTTDYYGVYKGKYIDFEAKETKSKTSFPLLNIKSYQISHLREIKKHGGIAFFIIYFSTLEKIYLLPIEQYDEFLKTHFSKSIPISYFKTYVKEIRPTIKYPINYIKYL